jgi:hypothetical protein
LGLLDIQGARNWRNWPEGWPRSWCSYRQSLEYRRALARKLTAESQFKKTWVSLASTFLSFPTLNVFGGFPWDTGWQDLSAE